MESRKKKGENATKKLMWDEDTGQKFQLPSQKVQILTKKMSVWSCKTQLSLAGSNFDVSIVNYFWAAVPK